MTAILKGVKRRTENRMDARRVPDGEGPPAWAGGDFRITQ